MADKILFVDDEPPVLEAYGRLLRNEFQLETAVGGTEGLAKLQSSGPFAVVVADMHMPEMDGAQFLAKVALKFPDAVRIMLTGNSDIQTAVRAVNEGNIFRFLTKPCEKDLLVSTVNAALVQHRIAILKDGLRGSAPSVSTPAADDRSAPARTVNVALEEAQQKVWQILGKTATIRLPATGGGSYAGKVIWHGPEHVVQRLSASIAIAHPITLLDQIPRVGDSVRIEYNSGTATVSS